MTRKNLSGIAKNAKVSLFSIMTRNEVINDVIKIGFSVRKDFPGMLIVFPVVQHLKDEAPIAHNKALRHCSSDNGKVLSQAWL